MVLLTQIPDIGPVHQQWLKSGDPLILTSIQPAEKKIQILLSDAINACSENNDYTYRQEVFQKSMIDIRETMTQEECYDEEAFYFMEGLLKRLLNLNEIHTDIFDPAGIFPDYEPKRTPDVATDYMPSLAGRIEGLPPAEPGSLPVLMELYKIYKFKARRNRGEWVEGNVILGANPEEYRPSEEELMLGEVGDRIADIVKNSGKTKRKKILKDAKIRTRKIKYTKFTFIHMDVMGSGRLFYVDTMYKTRINLRK